LAEYGQQRQKDEGSMKKVRIIKEELSKPDSAILAEGVGTALFQLFRQHFWPLLVQPQASWRDVNRIEKIC